MANAFGTKPTAVEAAVTAKLPSVDRIEVDSLEVRFETIKRVVAKRVLTGAKAEKLASLWRMQPYTYGISVMCHSPVYQLRFFKKDVLLFDATICFHCHNIYIGNIRGQSGQKAFEEVVFGSESDLKKDLPPSPNLHTFLDNLFPDPKDKSVYLSH